MFKTKVSASHETVPETAVADLQARCRRAGLDEATVEMIGAQAQEVLQRLVERAKELHELGSQMMVERTLSGPGYSIDLVFSVGERESLLRRALRKIGL